jgi:hypothetical protein
MKKQILMIILMMAPSLGLARTVPVGQRKYVIPEKREDSVRIVNEKESVAGQFMRDPIEGRHTERKLLAVPEKRKPTKVAAAIVHTEKSFNPLRIEGKILQPRVQFEREYIDIDQIEALPKSKFTERLLENLETLD